MNQKEFSKKDSRGKDLFVLVLSIELQNPDELVQEMRVFKEIVIGWHHARQKEAAEVKFIAVSDPKYHQAIEEFSEVCHSNDIDLKVIFESTELNLDLHDKTGKLVRERIFEKNKDASGILNRWFKRGK
ncbi:MULTISPECIES: hypothetical protein [unclassified Herbaspirillum]|uniref:hypothetical protein n=1 Tax=unclassified Herbaspirillum TaxID=2624150 RepID=UPI001154A028|nr:MULTISPECIES: hypothetical protein [unclassified Herbaspirillum]MBB5392506.1 hypothetical protein [Herbaspirillum sp. SJZ102]